MHVRIVFAIGSSLRSGFDLFPPVKNILTQQETASFIQNFLPLNYNKISHTKQSSQMRLPNCFFIYLIYILDPNHKH